MNLLGCVCTDFFVINTPSISVAIITYDVIIGILTSQYHDHQIIILCILGYL